MKITEENYHEHYAFGSGDVFNWLKGYRFFLDGRAGEKTRAMVKGSLAHCLLLEPQAFEERYVVCSLKSTKSKAYGDLVTQNPDKEVVLESDLDEARLLVAPFKDSPALIQAEKEKMLLCDHSGFKLKGKLDAVLDNMLFDFKTTTSIDAFSYKTALYGYHVQAYHYKLLYSKVSGISIEDLKFYFLISEKGSGYSKIVELDDVAYSVAQEQHAAALNNAYRVMKERNLSQEKLLCMKRETVDAYDSKSVATVSLPRGYINQHNMDMEGAESE